MASILGVEDGPSRVVYLNCGNYREEKTLFDVPSLVRFLKAQRLDVKEALERVLIFCAFSEEQQEQVVEEVRQPGAAIQLSPNPHGPVVTHLP